MCPLRRGDGMAATVVAAGSVASCDPIRITSRIVTVMGRIPPAAGTHRRSCGLQPKRSEHPREHKQQQKSCGQSLHVIQ